MKNSFRAVSTLVSLALLAAPLVAAAGAPNVGAIQPYSNAIIGIINNVLVPLIFGVAFIVFLYGVFRYFILGAANEEDREKGKQLILWGLIGLVVMIAVWGLVLVVMRTFGLTTTAAPPPPNLRGGSGG
jgi:zinc transporter ZupT